MAETYNKRWNMFDEDTLASEFYDSLCKRVSYAIFSNQEDIVYMAGELGKDRKPKLKDDAPKIIENLIVKELGYLIGGTADMFIKDLYENDIDMSEWLATEMNFAFGYEPDNEEAFVGVHDSVDSEGEEE